MKTKKRTAHGKVDGGDMIPKHVKLPRRMLEAIKKNATAARRSFQAQLLIELERAVPAGKSL